MALMTWPLTSDGAGAVTYTANEWRTIVSQLFDEGVFNITAGSLQVTERAAGANMNLDIAAGVAALRGTDATNQGVYLVREDVATLEAVTIATADPTNPRHDLVGIQLRDPSEGGTAGRDSIFAVVQGTAAATPVDPAVPDSFLALARVVVGAGVASITDTDINDRRTVPVKFEALRLLSDADTATGENGVTIGPEGGTQLRIDNTGIDMFEGGVRVAQLLFGSGGQLFNGGVQPASAGHLAPKSYVDGEIATQLTSKFPVDTPDIADDAITPAKIDGATDWITASGTGGTLRYRRLDATTVAVDGRFNANQQTLPVIQPDWQPNTVKVLGASSVDGSDGTVRTVLIGADGSVTKGGSVPVAVAFSGIFHAP